MNICVESNSLELNSEHFNDDSIFLIQQFYIDKHLKRNNEIISSLHKNLENKWIDKIILLNEREYSLDEMQLNMANKNVNKIQQFVISHRIMYKDIYEYIYRLLKNKKAYVFFSNSDIYFDETINAIRYSKKFHLEKSLLSLLRWESNGNLFGHLCCSSDAWCIHTNNIVDIELLNLFDIQLGKNGCENKMVYHMFLNHFKLYNVPLVIKANHLHMSNIRNYNKNQITYHSPYCFIIPQGIHCNDIASNVLRFNTLEQHNDILYSYISSKFLSNTPFIIPYLSEYDLNFIKRQDNVELFSKLLKISFKSVQDVNNVYLRNYKESFQQSNLYFYHFVSKNIEPYKRRINTNSTPIYIELTENYLANVFKEKNWMNLLANKKIGIIKNYHEQYCINNIIDLFKNTQFVFIDNPFTNNYLTTKNIMVFKSRINCENCDLFFCVTDGLSNVIANILYECGKSAICINKNRFNMLFKN